MRTFHLIKAIPLFILFGTATKSLRCLSISQRRLSISCESQPYRCILSCTPLSEWTRTSAPPQSSLTGHF
nr:MAG TPA: hypothetical protein [Caudoviricetes sp.]